jgi:hypothetical protein
MQYPLNTPQWCSFDRPNHPSARLDEKHAARVLSSGYR